MNESAAFSLGHMLLNPRNERVNFGYVISLAGLVLLEPALEVPLHIPPIYICTRLTALPTIFDRTTYPQFQVHPLPQFHQL
jgi:hypothetical protein